MRHRRKRWVKNPDVRCKASGKIRHDSDESAQEQIDGLKDQRKRRDRTLLAYLCEHCDGWHVGHSQDRKFTGEPE